MTSAPGGSGPSINSLSSSALTTWDDTKKKEWICLGRGGGQVVSVLAFYSDDLSSNPAEVYNFSNKIVIEKNENKQNEAGVGPFKKNMNMLRQS